MAEREESDEHAREPAIQVIVLGSGGGPLESNVTALLVRSLKTGWTKGSVVALDAGVHLSAITRIFEQTQPEGLGTTVELPHILKKGPFAGMELSSPSPTLNASHFSRHFVDTYLITHPHLDHISGFVINTAGLPGARPKRIAGLPSTISAFKQHIFNNVIWPNLSDENNGAGLVTYLRLVEGGSPALGEGDGKGYLEISDELSVKLFSVSHGHCIERHPHRGSASSSRFGSFDASYFTPSRGGHGSGAPSGPAAPFRNSSGGQDRESICVYDSSAYFIRDNTTGREVLMFGDVEPDSVSLSPRNHGIWLEAAPRIANGNLRAIFIECSFDNSQTDDRLFGHFTPRYIIQELKVLAAAVEVARHSPAKSDSATKKRKRDREIEELRGGPEGFLGGIHPGDDRPISPRTVRPAKKGPSSLVGVDHHAGASGIDTPHLATPTAEMSLHEFEAKTARLMHAPHTANALRGLKIAIIHIKEKLTEGEPQGDVILRQLQEGEAEAKLGCEFLISSSGQSVLV
ncbi:cAMP phosphodiesterase class-II [Xylariaceae sp. FL0594]|nr:cAMP phosphodiesterase class-II [Xylariaceae sp. FL0594]